MTVKRRPKGRGKSTSRGANDELTLEEWKRRKSEETAGEPKSAKPDAQTELKGRPE